MSLVLSKIVDAGDIEKERLVLKANSDIDIGEYLLAQTGKNETTVTNRIHNTFWFPDLEIKKGDLVVLYTKNGSRSTKENENNTSYFYYWGKEESVWEIEKRAAVLMHVKEWTSLKASQ